MKSIYLIILINFSIKKVAKPETRKSIDVGPINIAGTSQTPIEKNERKPSNASNIQSDNPYSKHNQSQPETNISKQVTSTSNKQNNYSKQNSIETDKKVSSYADQISQGVKIKEPSKPKVEETKGQSPSVKTSTNNSNNTSTTNLKETQKYPFQSVLREEEEKPAKIEQKKENVPQPNKGNVSLKYDPNTNQISDVKVDMDAETAFKLYQNNKQYLPTGQQMLSAGKATANFVEKSGMMNDGYEVVDDVPDRSRSNMVTGSKATQQQTKPKSAWDPLTSLFGMGAKKETKPSPGVSVDKNSTKKGQF
jgi:hypothetical protein